jgi:hypothetical protein
MILQKVGLPGIHLRGSRSAGIGIGAAGTKLATETCGQRVVCLEKMVAVAGCAANSNADHHTIRGYFSRCPLVLECLKEIDQVLLLLVCETDVEALVVEVHRVEQRGRRTVVEIGRACGQSPQNGPLDLADVGALS